MKRVKVLAVIGTRPEAVKMFPVIRELRRRGRNFHVVVCATGQHRSLLDAMLQDFAISPDIDLDLMRPDQTLNGVLSAVISGMDAVLASTKPDLVLVQGDTTTVLGATMAAFHKGVPVGHVEAGLRSFDLGKPFPEEANRLLVDRLSDLLFAPTRVSQGNLLQEGVRRSRILVTGNTSIDTLLWAARQPHRFQEKSLREMPSGPLAIITLHRRESFGTPLRGIFTAISKSADRLPQLQWVYPVHPNPNVRNVALEMLRHPRIRLIPPLGYLDFVHLMKKCSFIVTDSGGIQEEAPSLAKPVLVVREKTERTEFLGKGTCLVGVSGPRLMAAIRAVVKSPPPISVFRRNPFGDGRASIRIILAIENYFGITHRGPFSERRHFD